LQMQTNTARSRSDGMVSRRLCAYCNVTDDRHHVQGVIGLLVLRRPRGLRHPTHGDSQQLQTRR
jgi:hypothetical protein